MLLAIPLLPLLGFLINASFGRRISKAAAGAVACGAMLASFAIAVASVVRLASLEPDSRAIVSRAFTWISSGDFTADFTLRLDPLAAVMILVSFMQLWSRLNGTEGLSMLLWFGFGLANDVGLFLWSRHRLLSDLRVVATQRFVPGRPLLGWWPPRKVANPGLPPAVTSET